MAHVGGPLSGLVLVVFLFASSPSSAEKVDNEAPDAPCACPEGIELVGAPWVRLMPPTMSRTAAYLELRNTTKRDIEIVAGESPVAGVTELHEHIEDQQGVMRMRQVDSFTIPANGYLKVQPGSLHIMLVDLREPLEEGQPVPIELELEGIGSVHLKAEVRRVERSSGGGGHQHHHQR